MSEHRRSRDPLMLLIALALTPLLSGCFDMSFPGGGVSLRGGPYGGSVNVGFPGGGFNLSGGPMGGNLNVGFPGGGVNVDMGPGGGGVSVAAPGFNMNLGIPGRGFYYQEPANYAMRTQAALFPPTISYQTPITRIAQVAPPVTQIWQPPVVTKTLPGQGLAPSGTSSGLPQGW